MPDARMPVIPTLCSPAAVRDASGRQRRPRSEQAVGCKPVLARSSCILRGVTVPEELSLSCRGRIRAIGEWGEGCRGSRGLGGEVASKRERVARSKGWRPGAAHGVEAGQARREGKGIVGMSPRVVCERIQAEEEVKRYRGEKCVTFVSSVI